MSLPGLTLIPVGNPKFSAMSIHHPPRAMRTDPETVDVGFTDILSIF
jgi:hypothetical protein